MTYAAKNGRINILKWLLNEKEFKLFEFVLEVALQYGKLN